MVSQFCKVCHLVTLAALPVRHVMYSTEAQDLDILLPSFSTRLSAKIFAKMPSSVRFHKSEHQFHLTACFCPQVFWDAHTGQFKDLRAALIATHPPAAHPAGTDTQGSTSDASPGHGVSSTALLPILGSITQNTVRQTRGLWGTQNIPFPAAKSHWCCLLMCVNPLFLPLQRPYAMSHICSSQFAPLFPHIRISCSASLSPAWCRGAAWYQAKPSLSCSCGQALHGGRPCSLCDCRAQQDSGKGLALERCSDFTAKHNLPCRDELSSPTSLLPSGLTGSRHCWSRGC